MGEKHTISAYPDAATPGYTVLQYSWPGATWPQCECRPDVATCTMEGAAAPATYTIRWPGGETNKKYFMLNYFQVRVLGGRGRPPGRGGGGADAGSRGDDLAREADLGPGDRGQEGAGHLPLQGGQHQ